MRKYLLLIISLLLSECILADALDVSNVTAYQEGRDIVIEYDLAKANEVTAYVSVDGGDYVKLINATGDVGADIAAGHKRVIWNVLSQYERFEYASVKFKMETGVTFVKDICGNIYPVVKIGNQFWMAENMRCNKYDTSSEAYKAGRRSIPTSENVSYTPYYTDAANKNNWNYDSRREYGLNLTNASISKLGYLYNWSAAIGLKNGKSQSKDFSKVRQGICPNGWHVPSSSEWSNLANFLDNNKGYKSAGKKLKSKNGWYRKGNGEDILLFSILPAGCANGNVINVIGSYAYFWTSTPYGSYDAYYSYVFYSNDGVYGNNKEKSIGRSVRCVMN